MGPQTEDVMRPDRARERSGAYPCVRMLRGERGSRPVLDGAGGLGRIVGESPAMRRLFPLCEKLAASALPLIVEGETGTGKGLLAETLHDIGRRKDEPFLVLDCASLEDGSVELLLFGEEWRTGASVELQRGVFEEAGAGTVLIDAITELPLAVQARLLHVLERNEVCRVGGDAWIHVSARVIATSHKNVKREVELGRFREDLFFRLAATRIELPPLRDRQGDVALLATHFWHQLAAGSDPPADLLAPFDGYAWPGNVRELQSLVARKVTLGDVEGLRSEPTSVPASPLDATAFERVLEMDLPFSEARERVLAEFERCFVARVLAKHGGNVSRAAAASGVGRRYFQILRTRSR
jgi:two-component system, NtrC family, response regulator HydG